MTSRAKRLTAHAKRSPADGVGEWTLGMTDLRAFTGAFARLGYDVGALLEAAGLRSGDLDDPDARIPAAAWASLLEDARRQRPMANLGLRLAEETPLGTFPLLDYLVVTCASVGEGLKQLARYLRLVGTPVTLHIHEDEDPVRVVVDRPGSDFGVDFNLALPVLHLRRESGGRLTLCYASLAHRPGDVGEFERVLACPVRVGAGWNGFALSREAWELPLQRREPALRALLERQASEIVAALPRTDDVTVQVQRALAALVAGGDTRIEQVARDLGTSARTLQRRLSGAGVSYQDVLERTRRDAAERYLGDSSLSIGEVAYLLGYSEPSAFHRAFKRWRDETPQAFRARMRDERRA